MRGVVTLLVGIAGVALASPSAGAPADASHANTGARAMTKIPCYRAYDIDSIRLRTTPRRCMQFVDNEPNHANEVNLKRISWRHWGRRRTRGKAVWVYVATGGIESRTKVRLLAYKRVRYCVQYYSRLRVVWKDDRGATRRLTLSPPYPPGGCD